MARAPSSSSCAIEADKAASEVGNEVVGILKPDVKANAWSRSGRRFRAAMHLERHREALEPAPGKAHPEKLKTIEHCGDRRVRERLENDREETRCAGEIALPDRVSRRLGKRRIENACDLLTIAEPFGNSEGVLHMAFESDIDGPQA